MRELTKREISTVHVAAASLDNLARISKCIRSKVGSFVISSAGGLYMGVNGTLPDEPNVCEKVLEDGSLETLPNVIHAEQNSLDKMLCEGVPAKNCISVQTLSPCEQCFTIMRNVGISLIVYRDLYRNHEFLKPYIEKGMVMSYGDFCKQYGNFQ